MKKQLTVLAVLFGAILGLKAQQNGIIYTDFEPDSLVELKEIDFNPDAQMTIDFDADGNSDLRIYSRATSGGRWFYIMSYSNEWEIHEYQIEDPLIPMNEHGEWHTGITWLPYFYQGQDTINDKFAVRHQVGDSYYYGWFRAYLLMNGTSNPWVALDKMAYCTLPDYPITWGQTNIPEGIEENGPSIGSGALVVYPNPANDVLFVETRLIASLPDQTYRITNMMGQTLLQGTITEEIQQINIGNLPAGLYFLSLSGQTVKFVVR